MKPVGRHLATLWIILCFAAVEGTPAFAASTQEEIDEAVAALSTYEYGQSRKALRRVEELMRETHGHAELRLHLEKRMARLLLSSSATLASKQFLCRKLWQIGTDASLPALEKLLLDARTTEMACYALASRRSERVHRALLSALEKLEGNALIAVINLLGDHRNPLSARALSALIEERDDGVAAAAIAALGKIATKEAVKVLTDLDGNPNTKQRAALSRALLQSARGLASRGNRSEAESIYEYLSAPGHEWLIRRGAIQGRMELGKAEAVSTLLSVLRGSDDALKAAACSSFSRTGGDLVQVIREIRDQEERARVLSGLAGIRHPDVLELMTRHADASSGAKIEAKDEEGFVSIFDGKTLEGWEAMPATTAGAWVVKDGMIVGDGDKGRGYLVYENRQIADLELKLSYRFPGKGNSGVSIRAREDETGKRRFQSYHADLGHVGIGRQVLGAWDFHTPGRREHACFRGDRLVIDEDDKPTVTKIEGAVTKDDIKQGDWNTVHIIARGNNFRFFINGKPASEFTEHLRKEKRLERGMIQLQLHDPGMVVHFKDIRLKVMR